MMGSSDNKGLIPRLCDGLFEQMASRRDVNTTFKVEVSYMEIYNERVHDLLAVGHAGVKAHLRVREHNILGPYVDGLSTLAVRCVICHRLSGVTHTFPAFLTGLVVRRD